MDVAELSMFLDTLGVGKGDQSTIEFEEAAAAVKSCKNLDDAQKLQLYGLYKQSTVGDVTTDRPPLLDFVGAAKWYAIIDFCSSPSNPCKDPAEDDTHDNFQQGCMEELCRNAPTECLTFLCLHCLNNPSNGECG